MKRHALFWSVLAIGALLFPALEGADGSDGFPQTFATSSELDAQAPIPPLRSVLLNEKGLTNGPAAVTDAVNGAMPPPPRLLQEGGGETFDARVVMTNDTFVAEFVALATDAVALDTINDNFGTAGFTVSIEIIVDGLSVEILIAGVGSDDLALIDADDGQAFIGSLKDSLLAVGIALPKDVLSLEIVAVDAGGGDTNYYLKRKNSAAESDKGTLSQYKGLLILLSAVVIVIAGFAATKFQEQNLLRKERKKTMPMTISVMPNAVPSVLTPTV